MKNKHILFLLLFLTFLLPLYSQDDVKLFDFWKYYSDAENIMYKSSCELAFKQLRERAVTISRLRATSDYLARQEEVKEKILKLIGPLPEKTPLNPHVTGVIRKQDYRVEKLMFESLPGYYVTAHCLYQKSLKGKLLQSYTPAGIQQMGSEVQPISILSLIW